MDEKIDVDEKLIEHIARLARLELSKEEIKEFVPQLKEVFESFSKLQEANVSGVLPAFHPMTIKNKLRDDKVHKSLAQEEALSNSQNTKDGYFKAPPSV